ncbi:NADPH-dependent FMN reductase [Haploplasma axanthum]|uniref:FMN-dependent NADPH-azoreductase n=1 Tax=Haploplasma axanthum TaxID=29552 RepID=A0A449BDP3_HAPAX|nr:NAD(P)H-dependent oxidoreductase [Haploplasma axanthum]VEU80552.1 FMN-dependent NADPH-azoreductase [Haploplasma axanthum]
MKIGIITTTVREGRQSLNVANWVKKLADERKDGVNYEIVDLKDFNLPIFGAAATAEQGKAIEAWGNKINELDGFIFVTAEYNHSFSGVLKNALDFLKPQFANKAAALIGYGGVGAARAIEQLRLVLAELSVATTQRNVNLLLAADFINFSEFNPQSYQLPSVTELLDQVTAWSKALKTIR